MIKDYTKKRALLLEKQDYNCAYCGKRFKKLNEIQLAHKLIKSVGNLKVFGLDVIDHVLNLSATCAGKCNDGMIINRSRKLVVADHLEPICEDLEQQGYDVTELKKQIEDLRR